MEKAQNFKTDSLLALEACRPLTVQAHNGNWARIVTPLRLREWERVLSGHPDREFAVCCVGIRDGFQIGFNYRGAQCKTRTGQYEVSQEEVERYIGTECEARRLGQPNGEGTFPRVHISPFGVIPKSEPGKWRLIVDLSSPCGNSVNDGINRL